MRPSVSLLAALGLAACATPRAVPPSARPAVAPVDDAVPRGDVAAFVTRLGVDTVAVERFVEWADGRGVDATVVVRVPETTVTDVRLRTMPGGALATYEAVTRRPGVPAPIRRETVRPEGDSLRVTVEAGGTTRTRALPLAAQALPFVDLVHWPFERMLRRARAADAARTEHPLFTERGLIRFVLEAREGDVFAVRHPTRGTMTATVDDEGRLLTLDASSTTRKLSVLRVDDLPVEALAARFAARDAAGQGFGALSGRARDLATLGGATLRLDHGQPSARGRDLFGALVPWGERWRTGADQATHFETDRDLRLGAPGADLLVPAGRYTLSTIPTAEGGTLIVNRQTGQTGTSYDAAQDLGRVPMRRVALRTHVEQLRLRVVPTGGATARAGEVRIEWGRDAFVVPVRLAQ